MSDRLKTRATEPERTTTMATDSVPDLAASFRRRSDQLSLAGTEREEVPEVEEAADRLREADGALKAAKEVKDVRAEVLVDMMRAHGVDAYKYTDNDGVRWTIKLDRKTKVTIKRRGMDD